MNLTVRRPAPAVQELREKTVRPSGCHGTDASAHPAEVVPI